jgi:hypothetical protein
MRLVWCGMVLVGLAGLPAGRAKEPAVAPALEQGVVRTAADAKSLMGKRVVVLGTLERVELQKGKGSAWQGTGLKLGDDTVVYVTYGAPPAGWASFLGKRLAVHGALRNSINDKEQSLVAPHLRDSRIPEEVLEVGGQGLTSGIGRWVRLSGTARDAKGGAVLVVADRPIYLRGVDSWPAALLGKQVFADGLLQEEKLIPDPVVDKQGAISQGAEGMQLVLSAPAYQLAPAAAVSDSIGSATMEKDGTIVLMLRATGPGPAVGDALLRYPPDHPKYREILSHLGGLKPGESKPVPPFP